jgi:hypothetical protein
VQLAVAEKGLIFPETKRLGFYSSRLSSRAPKNFTPAAISRSGSPNKTSISRD